MNTIEVPGQKDAYQIPSEWDELRTDQVIKVLQLAALFTTGNMDYNKFVVQSFYIIADIRRDWRSVLRERLLSKQRRTEKFENIFIYAQQLTEFLFKPKDKRSKQDQPAEFYFNTVINYIPTFRDGNNVEYFGPENMLGDLTFGEFVGAIDGMNEYFRTREESDLEKFIVALYRPSADGIRRLPWDEEQIKDHARDLKKVPAYIKYGILLWFSTCIKYIKSADINISGKELNLSVLFPKSTKTSTPKDTGLGWKSVLYSVGKDGPFGPTEKTNSTNLFEVLMFMYDSHLQAKKFKSKT